MTALTDEQKKRIASIVHTDCTLIPGATFYNAAELAIEATLAASPAAPAQSVPVAWTADGLYDAIEQTLLHYRHSRIMTDDMESGYPLTDLLTVDGESIQGGYDEIRHICDAIYNEVLTVAAPPARPAVTGPVAWIEPCELEDLEAHGCKSVCIYAERGEYLTMPLYAAQPETGTKS